MAKTKVIDDEKALAAYKVPSKTQVAHVTNNVSVYLAEAQAIKVTSANQVKVAEEIRNKLKRAIKQIESLFEDSLAELKKAKAAIDSAKKSITAKQEGLTSPFEEALRSVNGKLIAFNKAEVERLEKLEAARIATEKAAAKGKKAPEVEVPKVKTTENRSEAMAETKFIDNWKAEVTDFALLPDEYKVVDQVKLNKAAREQKEAFKVPGAKAVNDKYLR